MNSVQSTNKRRQSDGVSSQSKRTKKADDGATANSSDQNLRRLGQWLISTSEKGTAGEIAYSNQEYREFIKAADRFEKACKKVNSEQPEDGDDAAMKAFECTDLTDVIFSFLDVKSLMNITFCSKTMMNKLTYEHVIRSSMMYGRYPKTTIERIVDGLDSLYVPTPLRLLRLVNGKRCERCCERKVNHVFSSTGLFLCNNVSWTKTCLHSQSVRYHNGNDRPAVVDIVPHFIPANSGNQYFILKKSAWVLDGTKPVAEFRGPLVTHDDLSKYHFDSTQIQQLLEQRRQQDPNRHHASAIREIYEACRERATRLQQQRDRVRYEKLDKAVAKKKKQIQEMLDYLSECWDGKPWKDNFLSYEWHDHRAMRTCVQSQQSLLYRTGNHHLPWNKRSVLETFVTRMSPLLICPKKGTLAVLREIADDVTKGMSEKETDGPSA